MEEISRSCKEVGGKLQRFDHLHGLSGRDKALYLHHQHAGEADEGSEKED